VHENVAPADLVEDGRGVALRWGEAWGNRRNPGLDLELWPVDRCQLEQLGEVEWALDTVDLRFVGAEAALQARNHLG
jgi:hypothetical protein